MIRVQEEVEVWSCPYEECGALCCEGSRELTHMDVRRIADSTGEDWEDFARFDEEEKIFKMKTDGENQCVFLDGLECSIHGERYDEPKLKGEAEPIVCRILPFMVEDVSYGDEPILYLGSLDECPGYGEGKPLDEEFNSRIEDLASQFLQEQHEMLKQLKAGKTPAEIVEEA